MRIEHIAAATLALSISTAEAQENQNGHKILNPLIFSDVPAPDTTEVKWPQPPLINMILPVEQRLIGAMRLCAGLAIEEGNRPVEMSFSFDPQTGNVDIFSCQRFTRNEPKQEKIEETATIFPAQPRS